MFPVGVYNVEDYPLNWIDGTYYSTYKGNTFQVSSIENVKSEAEYNAVTSIFLNSLSLTTDFTSTLLGKFNNLSNFRCFSNQISVLDVSQNTNLTQLQCYGNQLTALDVSQNINLTLLFCQSNQLTTLDISQNVNLVTLFCQVNQLTTLDISQNVSLKTLVCHTNQLDATTNSQILIDLDTNGQNNGLFSSSIFGGGSLTAAGQTAKINLLSKGWTIVGIWQIIN